MKKTLVLLVGMIAASNAYSFGGGYSLERGLFRNADINRSETISLKEAGRLGNYDLARPEIFSKFDTSGEGYIDFSEFRDYLRLSTPIRSSAFGQ